MDLGLRGRVALVAAASRGLGRAIADALAVEGAWLVVNARGADELEIGKRSIESRTGTNVHAIAADVSKKEELDRLTREALAKWGRIDILVTNAGGPPAGTF